MTSQPDPEPEVERSIEAELRDKNRLLDAIGTAQSLYIADTEPNKVFARLLESLLELTGSEYGFIAALLTSPSGEPYLKTRAITDIRWDEEARARHGKIFREGLEFHDFDNLIGACPASGQPVISNDPANDPRSGGLPSEHPPLHTFMGLPIRRGDTVIGMLGVANRKGGYDDEMARFLKPFLATCATMMEASQIQQERLEAEQDLRDQAERVHEISEFKNRLMSIVSHDLRSPLTSNIGLLKLLLDSKKEPVTDRQKKFLETMIRATEWQLNLVSDLLEYSRMQRDTIRLLKKPVMALDILGESLAAYEERAARKEVRLFLAGDETLLINVDKGRIVQVFNNLLDNAIKFTETGGEVKLALSLSRSRAVLSVCDNGTGIDPLRQETLFDPGQSASTPGTAGEKGSGLGLSICAELTSLNGGDFYIASMPGHGTTVYVTFELVDISPEEGQADHQP